MKLKDFSSVSPIQLWGKRKKFVNNLEYCVKDSKITDFTYQGPLSHCLLLTPFFLTLSARYITEATGRPEFVLIGTGLSIAIVGLDLVVPTNYMYDHDKLLHFQNEKGKNEKIATYGMASKAIWNVALNTGYYIAMIPAKLLSKKIIYNREKMMKQKEKLL